MRIIFATIVFCLFTIILTAQVGFTGAYYTQSIPEWESAVFGERSNDKLLNTGYSVEIDYKFTPFENYRVEFFPTFTYNLANSTRTIRLEKYELTQYEFGVKTNIFPLSLEADCDCPTFSREAGLLEKGFFIQIAPALSYFDGIVEENPRIDERVVSEDNGLNFKLGLGIGLEIGLSDNITLSPIIKYNRYFNVKWENLKEEISSYYQIDVIDGNNTTNINQFYGGLKLGIRFRP